VANPISEPRTSTPTKASEATTVRSSQQRVTPFAVILNWQSAARGPSAHHHPVQEDLEVLR
jgi:hypothetical protein